MEEEGTRLVEGTFGSRNGLDGERAEGLLVLGEILAEHIPESLGLLRAEVDSLEAGEHDLVGGILAHGAEAEEEVPDAHADLNAVGVALAIIFGLGELESGFIRMSVLIHCGSFRREEFWCERGDLNPHGLLRQILSLVRLPISPLSRQWVTG